MDNEFFFKSITVLAQKQARKPATKKKKKAKKLVSDALMNDQEPQQIFAFVEFYEHDLPDTSESKPDFDFCQLTIIMSDFKVSRPIFQAKLSSWDCLSRDIEWTEDYFASVRRAFDAQPNSSSVQNREEFYFDHPQAYKNLGGGFQEGLLYDTYQDGGVISSLMQASGSDLIELQNLLDSGTIESQGMNTGIDGGGEPCFEIWLRQPGGKAKVRIFSATRKHFKLQMTGNAPEVFAQKLEVFVWRKNEHIKNLMTHSRQQQDHIVQLEQDVATMRQKAEERENKLLLKFCLLLNEKKLKIKDLQINGDQADSASCSSEESDDESDEKSEGSEQASLHARGALDPSQILKRLQKLADTQKNVAIDRLHDQQSQLGSQLQFGTSLDCLSDQDLINSQVRMNTLHFLQSHQVSKAKHQLHISKQKANLLKAVHQQPAPPMKKPQTGGRSTQVKHAQQVVKHHPAGKGKRK